MNLRSFMLFGMGIFLFAVMFTLRVYKDISFDMKCSQFLSRASSANTIDLAKQNLDVAISYLEKNDLTNGIVSIFFKQPDNDIGYWYSNLKASSDELSKVGENTTQLERSNVLIKLRETLMHHTAEGTRVTGPSGLSIYPDNKLFFWLFMASIALMVYSFSSWVNDPY